MRWTPFIWLKCTEVKITVELIKPWTVKWSGRGEYKAQTETCIFSSGSSTGAILSNSCGQLCKCLIHNLPPVFWRSLHVTQHWRLILCQRFAPLPMHCHALTRLLLLNVGAHHECQNGHESYMKMNWSIWSFLIEWLPLSGRIWKQAGYLCDSFFELIN